mgnify:CR=1 FL=1
MDVRSTEQKGRVRNRLKERLHLAVGTLFLAKGIVGIALPLLPATPFLLLAAACYARGSERFYRWLMNNRVFGSYIRSYREGKGIRLRVKVMVLCLLWGTIAYSAFFVVHNLPLRIVLLLVALGVSTHILRIKTLRE